MALSHEEEVEHDDEGDAQDSGVRDADSEDASSISSEDSLSSSESSLKEDSSDIEDEDPEDDSVDVTLEFFDPREADFQGLKSLLQNFLDGEKFALSELVDTIIKQSTVGTVVKSGDYGEPLGVLTVLNTQRYKDLQCVRDIRAYLTKNCTSQSAKAILQKVWEAPDTGLLISERLLNCPPQLAPPLQQALFDEISWAIDDEPTQELKDSYKFKNFVSISRVFTDPTGGQALPKSKKKQKVEELIVYARPEDEFYNKHCTDSFTFSSGRAVEKDELMPLRLVMLLTAEQTATARNELDAVVGNVAAV